MTIKDYYSILGVSPDATLLTIKKAYRKLAHTYHPDKHAGNKLYEQRFRDITEAYKILSDGRKRNDYNYSRFDKNFLKPRYEETHTINSLLLKAKKLKEKVAEADPERMNKLALHRDVERILTPQHIQLFIRSNDQHASAEFVTIIMHVCRHLSYQQLSTILPILVRLASTNNSLLVKIRLFDKQAKQQSLWNEYKIFAVLMIVLIFCLLIFFMSS